MKFIMNTSHYKLFNGLTILVSSGTIIFLFLIVFVIAGIVMLAMKYEYDKEHGLNDAGAEKKYSLAMKSGDGQSAVYWAEKTIEYATKENRVSKNRTIEWLGYAWELNGEYDKALEVYERCQADDYYLRCKLTMERIQFKLHQREEAFRGYCQYANTCLEKYTEPLKGEWWNERNRALGFIRYPVTMEHDGNFMRLSPFLEYRDFLDFMEEEYQKLGEPPEYAAAMELFRAIDTEIDEKHLRKAPDQVAAMREQIKVERAADKAGK